MCVELRVLHDEGVNPVLENLIVRAEVAEIARVVMEHLDFIEPGCQYKICGG